MPMDSMFPRRRADRVGPVLEAIVDEICFVDFAARLPHRPRRSTNVGDAILAIYCGFTWPIYLAAMSPGGSAKPLDPLLDIPQRFETGPDRGVRNFLQHVGRDGVAQTVEIVDQLAAAWGEKQPVGAAVPGVVPPLQQAMLDQAIEQAHQRDRLQLQHIGKIDLRQSFLLPQSEQYDPLRARGAAALGAVVDVVAQQARAFDELRNQLAFQGPETSAVYLGGLFGQAVPKLSNCLEFSSYSVFTH